MPRTFDPSEDEQFFVKRYGEAQSETARRVEMEAFGHDVGVNGYTTVAQARVLCRHLRVGPGFRYHAAALVLHGLAFARRIAQRRTQPMRDDS